MTRLMKQQLDHIDKQILALLSENARLPVLTIAKKIGMARTTVIARLTAMEQRGIILGYGVRLHPGVVAAGVCAYVGLSVESRCAAALLGLLQQMPEVETLCAVSGPIDYMATLRCSDMEELDRLLDRIGSLQGVRQTSTSIILSRRIDRGSVAPDDCA